MRSRSQTSGSSGAALDAPVHRDHRSGGWWSHTARFIGLWLRSALGTDGVRVHRIWSGPRPESLHRAMIDFERSVFTSLLDGKRMTYEHPRDYIAFFRSIQSSRSFVARDPSGRVVGTISAIALRLRMPGGAIRRAVFVAHLRVALDARTGRTLPALAIRILPYMFRYGQALVAIVQTGRELELAKIARAIGMPAPTPHGAFRAIAWSTDAPVGAPAIAIREAAEPDVRAKFLALHPSAVVSMGGDPALRSAIPPRWLMAHDGSACGCIEDNTAVVTWRTELGEVFTQSHISFFGWRDAEAAGSFIRACIAEARGMGIRRLRVLVDESSADAVIRAVGAAPAGEVRWTVWCGSATPMPEAPWVLHPSEI